MKMYFSECTSPGEPCLCSENGCNKVKKAKCNKKTEECDCKKGYYIKTGERKKTCKKAKG